MDRFAEVCVDIILMGFAAITTAMTLLAVYLIGSVIRDLVRNR
jgi:hypothetical protein